MTNFKLSYLVGFLSIISNVCETLAFSCYNYYYYEYCYGNQNDCCGDYGYQYCCYTSIDEGAIAGIVVGCLIGIGVFVTLVIICCVSMNKNRGAVGRVVHPSGGTGLTVVNTSSQQQAMYGGQTQYGGGYSNPGAAPNYNHPPGPAPGPAYPPTHPDNPPSYSEQKM